MNYKLVKNTAWKEVEANGEIKKIPVDWNIELIKNLTKVTSGGTPSTKEKSYWNKKEIKWLSSGEVCNKKIYDTEKYISNEGLSNSSAKLIPIKSVLIALAGQGKTRGQVGIAEVELSTNQSVGTILPSNRFNPDYLFLNLLNRYDELRNLSGGDNGRGGLNLDLINNIAIILPQITKQSAIVSILYKQENIISNINQLIKKNEIIFDELSDKILLGEIRLKEVNGKILTYKNPDNNWEKKDLNGKSKNIPSDWGINKVRDTIQLNMGSTPKKEDDNYIGDLPWITISNLDNKYICEYTAKIKRIKNIRVFPKGSLLVSFKMSVGKVGFTTEDSAINEAIMGIQQSGTNNDLGYLYYCLPEVFFNNADRNGQGLLLLNQEKIKDLDYAIPNIEEQKLISHFLDARERLIINLKELLLKEKEKFKWLSDNLLSGNFLIKDI